MPLVPTVAMYRVVGNEQKSLPQLPPVPVATSSATKKSEWEQFAFKKSTKIPSEVVASPRHHQGRNLLMYLLRHHNLKKENPSKLGTALLSTAPPN